MRTLLSALLSYFSAAASFSSLFFSFSSSTIFVLLSLLFVLLCLLLFVLLLPPLFHLSLLFLYPFFPEYILFILLLHLLSGVRHCTYVDLSQRRLPYLW